MRRSGDGTEAGMGEWWTEDSGPYVLQMRDGTRRTEVDSRQEVYDILDAMAAPERHRILVMVDWREDDGDYVYHLLRPQVEP